MKIKEKIMMDMQGLSEHGPINIAIFGDSVSHGAITDYIDYESTYPYLLKKKLNRLRDYVPVNIINASIGGTRALGALPRLEKHVLPHRPDLVIVSFGLNDVNGTLEDYIFPLGEIFEKCLSAGFDTIFMTPNMLNTYVADDTPAHHTYAAKTAELQNSGKMDAFVTAAIRLASEMGVPVCDCYQKWKTLSESVDTTLLLANRINHPTIEMHQLFADALYDMIMGDTQTTAAKQSTMYED